MDWDTHPFNVPAIRSLDRIEMHPAVTFFIGENGTGKSTLLEAIAVRLDFNPEGGGKGQQFTTRTTHSGLFSHLVAERNPGRWTDGYFLRAESLYNVASYLEQLEEEPFCGHGFRAYGGTSLHAQSHGEAFFAILNNRLQGDGVYIFDEPEAALSPQRQLAALALIHRLVCFNSQLIIATHSPILLAYPHARIYEFDSSGIRETTYAETEHFRVTRDFLNAPDRMIELLLREGEAEI